MAGRADPKLNIVVGALENIEVAGIVPVVGCKLLATLSLFLGALGALGFLGDTNFFGLDTL